MFEHGSTRCFEALAEFAAGNHDLTVSNTLLPGLRRPNIEVLKADMLTRSPYNPPCTVPSILWAKDIVKEKVTNEECK